MADTVNASIPLSVNTPQPFDVSKMLSLADMAQMMRIRQTQIQNKNALSQVLANPQSYDQNGDITQPALRDVMRADPNTGIELKNQSIQENLRRAQERHYQTESGKASFDFMSGIAGTAYDAYTEAKKTGTDEQGARAAAIKARNAAVDASGGMLSEEQQHSIRGSEWDPVQGKAFASMNKDWITGSRAQSVAELGLRKEDTAERRETERERADREREGRLMAALFRGGKAPTGFEWDPSNPDQLRPIKGGPKDPNASNMSGRESVYFKRVTSSANEAVAAIDNIVQLPVGTSSGWLGVGSSPGHSLFSSAKGVLTNKLSSQETQDYNTMLPGIKRNLATIESAGLAPSGSLTENFAGLELREGDTSMTKLRKLAEMRQIVEKGIETNLYDPHVPEPQKEMVRQIIGQVSKAVPFTQNDITRLQREQQSNPNMTLDQLMKSKGLGARGSPETSAPAARGASDTVKAVSSKAEYDRLPRGAQYSKPGDPPGSYRTKQ